MPGYGIYNREGTTEEQKWYDPGAVASDKNPDGLEIGQQAQLDVAECPVGKRKLATREISDLCAAVWLRWLSHRTSQGSPITPCS
jgi:hypothetical protein